MCLGQYSQYLQLFIAQCRGVRTGLSIGYNSPSDVWVGKPIFDLNRNLTAPNIHIKPQVAALLSLLGVREMTHYHFSRTPHN